MSFFYGGDKALTPDEIKAGALYGNAGFDKQRKLRKGKILWLTLGESTFHHLATDPNTKMLSESLNIFPLTWNSLIEKRLAILKEHSKESWQEYEASIH
jgi:hypothetical protein